mmetsp:Transcript_15630/g.51149  ORF Transcript_15630/g.51149 Transcript_15630/m.51149 type:complete len:104 (+) Transcript_15630:103-414(+)|eukprot:CAMPEP_0118919688 /NCGR_PEP_ID=MMETSP1166-20130328/18685_1 /TAXON_ID=1104430 /ORGANISM="Chrysoreinhardia sp, Strain CCMP3193" /LENGTH=103 /DNA_ID=CAMNT_0006860217 /DNA_START=73 /DNA_END=384 /DNA_ORIENTATION=-
MSTPVTAYVQTLAADETDNSRIIDLTYKIKQTRVILIPLVIIKAVIFIALLAKATPVTIVAYVVALVLVVATYLRIQELKHQLCAALRNAQVLQQQAPLANAV